MFLLLLKSVEEERNGVQFFFLHSKRTFLVMCIMSHIAVFLANQIGVIPVEEHVWSCAYFELKECIKLCCLDQILQIFRRCLLKGQMGNLSWGQVGCILCKYVYIFPIQICRHVWIYAYLNDNWARYGFQGVNWDTWFGVNWGQVGHMFHEICEYAHADMQTYPMHTYDPCWYADMD